MRDVKNLIERTLGVVALARSKDFLDGRNESFAAKIEAIHEELTPGAVAAIIDYYEGEIAKIQITQHRIDIIKDAIREVVREELKRN